MKKLRKSKNKQRRQQIYNTADFLIKELKKHNIVVQRYNSRSSNSIYLKLDYGVLNSIRISDHKGKDHLKYKYNALTVCPYPISTKNKTRFGEVVRHYVPVREKEVLLNLVLQDRSEKKDSYGERNYRTYMDLKVAENYAKTGFWQHGEIV
ncbi:hypothetical protein D7X33_35075 [Butyricicoccus sp. 1XD8-22]|nr:hypothetical protein D7X33_35075 [Butyricicoccus sp. 1XD8-22]